MPDKKAHIVYTEPIGKKGKYKIYSVKTKDFLGTIEGDNAKKYWEAFDETGKFLISSQRKKQCMDFFRERDTKKLMAQGGGIGFEKLSKQVAKEYEGDKVAPKYQDEYGKTYSKLEAREVGDKVAGKVYWQQQGRKFGDGGGIEDTHMRISKAIFLAYGNIDDAVEFKEYEPISGVSPYRLVLSAVQKGWITPEEINRDVLNSAYETSSETEEADEIGSSDMNHYVWSMLRDAGFDMKIANGKYIRVDKMATGGTTSRADEFLRQQIEKQRKEEEGKYFAPFRAFVYEDSYQFADFQTDDFQEAVKWAIETLEKQRDYRQNSKRLWAIVDEFIPIEKRNNVIYAYSEAGRFGEEDIKKMKYSQGGSMSDRMKTYYIVLADGSKKEFTVNHPKEIAGIYFAMGLDRGADSIEKGLPMVHYNNELAPLYHADGTPVAPMPELAGKDYFDLKNKMAEGGNTTFYYDQAKKTLGEELYNFIASLNEDQLEIQLKRLQAEIERMKAYDTEFTKQEFLPKLKQEEKFILYRLGRLNEFKYEDGGNVDKTYERTFRNNAGKDILVKIMKNPIFGKYDYWVDGSVRGTFDTYEEAYGEIQHENFDMYAKGGLVVTSIKDIPNFKEELEAGRITYRGLGMGKLSNDFYKIAGEGGTRIKVKGKEYFIADTEFNTFSRDKDGYLKVRFDAPRRRFDKGGNFDSEFYKDGGKFQADQKLIIFFESGKGESWIYSIKDMSGKTIYANYMSSSAPKEIIELVKELEEKYSYYIYQHDHNDKKYYGALVIDGDKIEEYDTSTDKWLYKKRELGHNYERGGNFDSEFYKEGGSVGKQKYAYVQAETSTGKKVFKFFEEVPTHKEVYAYFRSFKDENGNPITLKDTTIHVEEVTDFDRDLFLEKCNEIAISTFGSPIKELDDRMFSFDKNTLSVFKFEAELENGMDVSIQTVDGMIVIEAEEEDEDKFKDGGKINLNLEKDTDYIKRENIKLVKYKDGKEVYNWEYWYGSDEDNRAEVYSGLVVSKSPITDPNQYSMFKEGGKMPEDAMYIKRSDIDSVIIYDEKTGNEVEIPSNKIVSGIWFDNSRAQILIDRAKKEGLLSENKKKNKK